VSSGRHHCRRRMSAINAASYLWGRSSTVGVALWGVGLIALSLLLRWYRRTAPDDSPARRLDPRWVLGAGAVMLVMALITAWWH
jgi:hypothetical protein